MLIAFPSLLLANAIFFQASTFFAGAKFILLSNSYLNAFFLSLLFISLKSVGNSLVSLFFVAIVIFTVDAFTKLIAFLSSSKTLAIHFQAF
jgi:hypothetical protein